MTNYNKLISLGALVALIGYIVSGPIGFVIVRAIKPQPAWSSPGSFAAHYHMIQDLPFYFGFLLIGGMLMLAVGHYLNYNDVNPRTKFHLLVSVGWTVVFVAEISFNYVCQTTFVRHLALNYRSEYDTAIAAFSMANPMSFCWANEIWGYGFLGIANWLMSGYYAGKNNLIRFLLIANGVVSTTTVVLTIISVKWLLTSFGLSAYFVWNVLMIALMALIYNYSRRLVLISVL